MEISDIKNSISQLPLNEQAAIAQWIIANFDESDIDKDVIDIAWRKEIRKRVNEVKSGKVKMIASEEMWKDLLFEYEKTS
ncbi:MAG: addiction module protein [Desulfobacterales bacterium]|nr:addiction module protein [Desulfobacterales bacterium]MBF0395673.1 addiction module protein [Desulfobacterales bacterium]